MVLTPIAKVPQHMNSKTHSNRLTLARNFQAEILKFYSTEEASGQLHGDSFSSHKQNVQNELAKKLEAGDYPSPQQQPVCRFLDDLLSTSALTLFGGLTKSIQALSPFLCWKLNQNYRDVFPDHFFENESFAEIIGPGGLLYNQNMRAGLLLLGEAVDYPSHYHEATEWYHVINGSGLWQQDNSDYRLREPGSAIFHRERENHAMRCKDQAVLALWSWSGELDCVAIANPSETLDANVKYNPPLNLEEE